MKYAIIMMAVIVAGLAIAVFVRGGTPSLFAAGKAGITTGGKMIPILLLAFLIMGSIQVLLPSDDIEHWLSDAAGWRGIVTAWIAGILTPAGSLVGLPIVAGLAKAGASPAVLMTYLVSVATLSIIRLPLEVGILGWRTATLRIGLCIFLPPLVGIVTRVFLPFVRLAP